MNLKKWISTITLCATVMATSVSPVLADDTASVDKATPNFTAVAQAMNAAQIGNDNNAAPSDPGNNGSTEEVGIEYINLTLPAESDNTKTYLALRETFGDFQNQALDLEWKPNGEEKIRLTNASGADYEAYIVNNTTGLQIQKGGTTYDMINLNGKTYVEIAFFQDIIGTANIAVANGLLVVRSTSGTDIWNNPAGFWSGMNNYTAPKPAKPEITYPDINNNPNNSNNSNNTNNNNTNNNSGASIGSSVVPVKVVSGGNGLIADTLFWPTSVTYVSSGYAYRVDPFGGSGGDFHLGVDIAGPVGTAIYAAQGGTVIRASWFDTYGNCIDIQHPSGLVTRYAHLSSYNVAVGDTVVQGQTIAGMGATGNVTGSHLHFETRINGKTVDPAEYLNLDLV